MKSLERGRPALAVRLRLSGRVATITDGPAVRPLPINATVFYAFERNLGLSAGDDWAAQSAEDVGVCRELAPLNTFFSTGGMKRRQLRGFDLKQVEEFASLIGVDEVGRGALAGPVVAAAVLVNKEFLESRWATTRAAKVNDSKQLTAAEREELWIEFDALVAQGKLHATFGVSSVEEIESFNILGATKLAMRRALEGIYPPSAFVRRTEPDLFSSADEVAKFTGQVSCRILIDGLPLKSFPYPHVGVVRGDARSLCVAMASIVAKVTRDRMMQDLDAKYPHYGFAQHKGYGTEEHRLAVLQHGASNQHRTIFLRKLLNQRADAAQMNFLADD